MIVYRIGKTKFSRDTTGTGAKLHGGRWNHIGTPCIYASESRALAVLEYTVNVNVENIPRSLSITTYEIPDASILLLAIKNLPGNWTESPSPTSTKDFGTSLLSSATSLAIKIPSAVIPQEFNFLLNPSHVDFGKLKTIEVKDFVYDIRIKSV